MKKLTLCLSLILASLSLTTHAAFAATDLVVITNPNSGVDKMTRDEVTAIFMGRSKKLPSGLTALPIDQPVAGGKGKFYAELINKELAEINSYWARLIFSGQGTPPRQADDNAEILEIVSSSKGAIAYLPRAAVDKRVKVVLDLSVTR